MATDKPGITEAETQPQLIIVYFRHCSSAAVDILQFSSCIKTVTAQEVIRRQESAFRVILAPSLPHPPPLPSDLYPLRVETDSQTEKDTQTIRQRETHRLLAIHCIKPQPPVLI